MNLNHSKDTYESFIVCFQCYFFQKKLFRWLYSVPEEEDFNKKEEGDRPDIYRNHDDLPTSNNEGVEIYNFKNIFLFYFDNG